MSAAYVELGISRIYWVLSLAFGAVLMLALLPIVVVVVLLKFAFDRG